MLVDKRETNALTDFIFTYEAFNLLDDGKEIEFEQLDFSHPLVVLVQFRDDGKTQMHSSFGWRSPLTTFQRTYTSWKCLRRRMYFSLPTTGWMMWNWLSFGISHWMFYRSVRWKSMSTGLQAFVGFGGLSRNHFVRYICKVHSDFT